MKNKTLILLCDNYPLSAGEFFIDDEMRVIAPRFEKVILYTASAKSYENLNRFVPDNTEIVQFSRQKLEVGKIKSFFRIFKPMFLRELAFAIRKLPIKYWVSAFKIMYVDIHRATNLKNELLQFCNHSHLNVSDCIFYSYWHDYKALALALLRKESKHLKCIARAHGGDVFRHRFNPPYIPFKHFIISSLSCTITVSYKGKNEFSQYNCLEEKIKVSHLGKFNSRLPMLEKINKDKIVFVSCSNLIADKRVNLIIDVISAIDKVSMEWHHFGKGELEDYIKGYADRKLKNVYFKFYGCVDNRTILEFYANNYVDLFINLSKWEGIPVSVMEALSAGIPVVATDVGGTSEAVNDEIGFLVPAIFNNEDVATIISNYLSLSISEQQSYRRKAYQFWKENYEAATNYRKFCDILENL